MTPKDVEIYYDRLRKKGQAAFKIIFKAGPGDLSFSKDDPVADVTISFTDPARKKAIPRMLQMSAKACESEQEIHVLDVVGVVKSLWRRLLRKEVPEEWKITITVEPHPDWAQNYTGKTFWVVVRLGRNPPQHVWMVRKEPPPTSSQGKTQLVKLIRKPSHD